MVIGARTAAWSGAALPYDAEVEYLGVNSDQKSYIVTTTTFDDLPYSIDVSIPESFTSSGLDCSFFGFESFGRWTREFICQWGRLTYGGPINRIVAPEIGAVYNLTVTNSGSVLSLDGVVKESTSANDTEQTGYLKLFKVASIIYHTPFRIHSFSSAVNDMITVRFTNENGVNEGAMYDRITKQLFRNAGTGAFIIGPDVSSANGGGV